MDLAFSILSNRLRWLINLRWVFCSGVIVVVWLSSAVLDVVPHPGMLYVLAGMILLYNAVFVLYERYKSCDQLNLNRHILVQMITVLAGDRLESELLYYAAQFHSPSLILYVGS